MPVKVRRRGGRYRVTDGGRVTARGTTRRKAARQARLLRAVAHGWKPGRRSR
jgi:hypothetical protein